MKPAPFKYVEVADEDALAAALAEYGDEASLLAGGQSLVPMMNFRVVSPEVIIDLNRIDALSYIDCREDTLRIGALTRHAMLEDSSALSRRCPLLSKAVGNVAHRAVRNRGTTGGTLALAYPGAEIPLALMTLGADIVLRSQREERRVGIGDFILGSLDTALAEDEYIRHVEVELPPPDSIVSFVETSRRHGDFAIAVAAVVAARNDDGQLSFLHIGVSGGVGAPVRVTKLEQMIVGSDLDDQVIAEGIHETISEIEVFGDHHYPEDFRRHVIQGVLRRALNEAIVGSERRHVQ